MAPAQLRQGGIQALPEIIFPGGALLGCDAGFMNGGRIKGIHAAIKSGMLAADAVYAALAENRRQDMLNAYPDAFRQSWLYDDCSKSAISSRGWEPICMSGR